MAPPELPRRPAAAGPAGRAWARQMSSQLIPTGLRPSWRNLPALAWLAVRRLDTKLQAAPVLGPVAAWCAAPLMLLTLACAHADGHLAAKDRHAALWIRPLSATGRGVRTPREMLITTAAFLPPGLVLLLALAIGADAQACALVRVIALALALAGTIGVGPLLALFGVNRWRDLTTRTGQQHRRLATQTSTPLVVVQGLVADPLTGAGTALIRALRVHADQLGVGIAAVARDERLLPGYLANGFVQTEPDPASRLLYRPPGRGRRCDLSRNDD